MSYSLKPRNIHTIYGFGINIYIYLCLYRSECILWVWVFSVYKDMCEKENEAMPRNRVISTKVYSSRVI